MNKEIVCLGPEGSYSHIAALEIKKKLPEYNLLLKDSFLSIHEYIIENKEAIAVLPFENSITSNIYENVEFVFDSAPNIIDDLYLPIKLNLIGKKDSVFNNGDVVYSHPKALKQCSKFLESVKARVIAVSSTSKAQEMILLKDENCFAIAGQVINDDLEVKRENIGNFSNNKTRFIVVTMENTVNMNLEAGSKKISFLCQLHHNVGSLKMLLSVLEAEGINMTKIESKPIPNSDFEYSFMIEGVKSHIDIDEIQNVLNNNTLNNKILGVYDAKGR